MTTVRQHLEPASGWTPSDAISAPRLAPYVQAAGGDTARALRLYRWNIEVSAAFYEVLHIAEIALRNAIDAQLRVWNRGQGHSTDWLLDPAPLIQRLMSQGSKDYRAEGVSKARRNCGGHGPGHDDVVAALSLGTWINFFPGSGRDAGRQRLWDDAVSLAFPALGGHGASRNAESLTGDSRTMLKTRNRIAHLEPLLDTRIARDSYDSTVRCVASMDERTASWMVADQRVLPLLARKDQLLASPR